MRRNKRKLSAVAPLTPSRVSSCRLDQLATKPPYSPKRSCTSSAAPTPPLHRSSSANLRAVARSVSAGKQQQTAVAAAAAVEAEAEAEAEMAVGAEEQSSVRVAVRVRPFTVQELQTAENRRAVRLDADCLVVDSEAGAEAGEVRFSFDHCFWSFSREEGVPFASQEMVYETLGSPLVDKALEGFNVCLFAYGMTSSGKSYSILGNRADEGIIPRLGDDIFQRKEALTSNPDAPDMHVEISFYEVYNEKIHDLFAASHDKSVVRPELRVREHPEHGPYVEGLASFAVKSPDDVRSWLSLATKFRATAATSLNEQSSRSHAVFVLAVHRAGLGTARFNVVDLAGCERTKVANTSGIRQKEGAAINRSLLTLGRIIAILAEHGGEAMRLYRQRKIHIPFRDSTLTWLLKESLGGSSQTAMLATISPAASVVEETLNTLRYAAQTRRIVNCARVCEDPKARVIRELRTEISRLQAAAASSRASEEVLRLQGALKSKEEEVEALRRNWQAEAAAAEQRRLQELRQLENCGLASPRGPSRAPSGPSCNPLAPPALMKLHADPLLHETLTYPLRPGDTLVSCVAGREGCLPVISLAGPLIAERHCLIKYINDCLRIEPIDLEVGTYVNGQWLEKEAVLHDDDRLVFGEHYFRVRLNAASKETGDFERARREHLRGRESRGHGVLRAAEVASLRDELRTRENRIRALEDALRQEQNERQDCVENVRRLEADVQILKKEKETPARTKEIHDIGVGSASIEQEAEEEEEEEGEEQLVLRLWVSVTEANQICRKMGVNAHFSVKPSVTAPPAVKVELQDRLSALWTPQLFEARLQALQEMWERDANAAAVLDLLHNAQESWDPLPIFSERSFNASTSSEGLVANRSAGSLLLDDKEAEIEMAVALINSFQTSLTDAITNLAGPAADSPSTLAAALSHLDAMFAAAEQLTGADPLDPPALLPPLCAAGRHAMAAVCLLRPDLCASCDLRLATRRLANMLPVFCANLRYRLRGLIGLAVEEHGLLERIRGLVRAVAALAASRGVVLDPAVARQAAIAGELRAFSAQP